MFLVWFSNSMQEKKTQRTSSMFTDSKQVKMMHYWQSSYGMLHSWQKNATNEQKNVMCYPQNCVIHTLPPLLFILCAKHTKPHHPQNDKQNLESTNFLEALVKFDESCKKVNVAYWGKMGVYLHRIYIYRGAARSLFQSSAAMRSHYIIMPQSPKIESHVTLFARWEESSPPTSFSVLCTFWRKKK